MPSSPPGSVPAQVVVMGVSGTGKTTVAAGLAEELGADLVESDDLHPAGNVAKMTAGTPLTDVDRWPWLERLAEELGRRQAEGRRTVLTCSALRRSYRDLLRRDVPAGELLFVHLGAPAAVLEERLAARTGHFMPASLLQSQLATIEPLEPDEPGVVVDVTGSPQQVLDRAVAAVHRPG